MKINPLKSIANSKFLNKHIGKVINDDAFAAKALVTINVAKDVFAYARRFQTTMKNKDIPDEKRPFVAAMDLMSGAVTAIVQLVVGFSLTTPKVIDKLWGKLSKGCTIKDPTVAKKGFSQIVALIGSTIIAERVIVPLIATPVAEIFEKKVLKHDGSAKSTKTNTEKPANNNGENLDINFENFKQKTKTQQSVIV